jgi:hypothetical protein
MNIRRILISEQEKKDILSQYSVDTNLVNEQLDKTTGKYSLMNPQVLKDSENSNKFYDIKIPKGTLAWHDFNSNDTKVWIGSKNRAFTSVPSPGSTVSDVKKQSVYYDCASNLDDIWFKTIGDFDGLVYNESLSKVIRATFCNGKKMKTWEEITGGGNKPVVPPKDTTGKKCYTTDFTPTYAQICKLPNDTVWMYAKDDSGKWYTSKQTDTKKWCELVLPQYQKAVDTLIKGCPTTIEPIKLSIKPIEVSQQPGIQVDPKQQLQKDLNTAQQGMDYLQNQQNKGI